MKKKKIILIGSIGCITLIVLCIASFFFPKRKLETKKLTVTKEIVKNVIDISGNISAANQQTLQASSDGTVERVFVKEGDFVKKNDPLVWMDSVEQDYNLKKQDYNIEQERLNGSQKKLELLLEERKVLEKKLEDKKLFARFDGVVASLTCDPGDFYEAGIKTFGEIIDRSYLEAVVEIVEDDVRKLKVGQKVTFDFPALDEKNIIGYVRSYPAVGKITDRGATVVEANIRIDTPPDNLLPGYSFTGEIYISDPETILSLPAHGIKYEKGETFVEKYLENEEKTEKVKVTVSPYSNGIVKILSGLKEGDVVKAQREPSENMGRRRRGGAPPR